MSDLIEEPILLSIICEEKGLTEDEGVKIAKEMGIKLYSRGRGDEGPTNLRYWVVRSNFIEGWLKDFRAYAQPTDFKKRKGYTPSTSPTEVKTDSSDAEEKLKDKIKALKKQISDIKKDGKIDYGKLSDVERCIYGAYVNGAIDADSSGRKCSTVLIGKDSNSRIRDCYSNMRKYGAFGNVDKKTYVEEYKKLKKALIP